MESEKNKNIITPSDLLDLMKEMQEAYVKSNKTKDKIIRLLIILMFFEAAVGFSGFVWFESQFDYVVEETTTTTTTETDNSKDIDVSSEGDGSEATYIDGNQYNDSSSHNEGGDNE